MFRGLLPVFNQHQPIKPTAVRKIKLYISNDLEALASTLANNLKSLSAALQADYTGAEPEGGSRSFYSVFQPFHVVSQTVGMDIWLKTQLAQSKHLGITANICFLKPNDLISEMYALFNPEKPQVFSCEQLQWVLFTLLNEPEFTSRFTKVAGYYNGDEVKRMALAAQLADLFDQYQIYRYKELIENWNKGPVNKEGHAGWQSWLWYRAKQTVDTQMPDKTTARAFLLDQLNNADAAAKLALAFPQIHLFGNSILTPFHTELLYKLSQHISIHLYFTNPAPCHYWLEDKSEKQQARSARKLNEYTIGNTLMVGWGRVISNTLKLFVQDDVLFDHALEVGVKKPGTDTLLQKLQQDIFENAVGGARQELNENNLADGSVIINSCYTPVREVEVLKDYLVNLIDTAAREVKEGKRSGYLSPRDIVVMVPDIDAYAPFIDAVFGEGEHRIPYTIADQACSSGSTLLQAVETILNIDEERCAAEELMQLLDFAPVRDRFGITDTAFLRRAVADANIRFGLQGCTNDDTIHVSWQNGLRRLLLGYCMKGVETYVFEAGADTLLPLELAEGSQGLEVLRLWQFFKTLEEHLCQRREKKTLLGWTGVVDELVENLVCEPDKATGADHRQLAKWLEKLRALDSIEQEPVSFTIFKHYFLSLFSSEKKHADFQHGGITFCSMIPMRSVPFTVVALLGMNNGTFPRKEQRLNFNLIDGKDLGDRNVRDNDKHLFLETLLSARENMYISYLGRSCKDNSDLPPSILVDELLDYIEMGVEKSEKERLGAGKTVRSVVVCQHPLHGFSKQYKPNDLRLFTYRNYGKGEAKMRFAISESDTNSTANVVSVEEFINFFKHPIKAYYNKVLGIYYGNEEMLLPCTEKFELDSLDGWKIKDELLRTSDENYTTAAVKRGLLPLKNMAALAVEKYKKEVEPISKLLQKCEAGLLKDNCLKIDLQVAGLQLTELLSCYSDNRIIVTTVSKTSGEKYLVEAYLRYLIAAAAGYAAPVFAVINNKGYTISAGALSQQVAMGQLEALMQKYLQGQKAPLLFCPDFLKPWNEWDEISSEQEFNKLIYSEFNPAYDKGYSDFYLEQQYRNGWFAKPGTLSKFRENLKLCLPGKTFQPFT